MLIQHTCHISFRISCLARSICCLYATGCCCCCCCCCHLLLCCLRWRWRRLLAASLARNHRAAGHRSGGRLAVDPSRSAAASGKSERERNGESGERTVVARARARAQCSSSGCDGGGGQRKRACKFRRMMFGCVSSSGVCFIPLGQRGAGSGGSITHPVSFLPPYSYSCWAWRLSMSRGGAFGCGQYTCMRSD